MTYQRSLALAATAPGSAQTTGAPPAVPPPSPAAATARPAPTNAPQSGAPQSAAPVAVPAGTRGGLAQPPPPLPAVLPPVPNIAPNFTAPTPGAVPNGDLIGVVQQPFVGLALADAIGMSLARSTDLAVAQSNERIAGYQIVAARGAYDVRFQVVPSYQHSVSPVLSPLAIGPGGGPVTQDTTGGQAFFSGLAPSGVQYRVGATGSRVTTNELGNLYSSEYFSSLQASVTLPLLRGRSIDDARRAIVLARAQSGIQTQAALTAASQTVTNVADAYWSLVAAWRNVAIQEEGLRQAAAQAASNARLSRQGAVAPSDIVEANTQVDVFQDNVFSALQNVQRLQNQLKSLIVADPGDPVWRANLVPTTSVAELPQEPTLDALVTSAIRNRPEIAQLRAQRDIATENLAYARDAVKPQLDLGLGYTSNGFAGQLGDLSQNPLFAGFGSIVSRLNAIGAAQSPGLAPIAFRFPPPPNYQTGRLGQSFQNALNNRFPTYSAQLTFSYPLGNTTARANLAIANEQAKQVSINEVGLLQRFRSEAANAIQGLRSAQYRLISARNAREASERVLLAEQRRFQAGTSTTFLILQRQLDVANQRGRELQAQTDVNTAAVELARVGGTLFAQYGIDASRLGGTTLDAGSPTASRLP